MRRFGGSSQPNSLTRQQLGTAMLKALTVENPTASENINFFTTPGGLHVRRITATIRGTGSVTFTLRFGANRAGPGTEIVTGGIVCADGNTGVEVSDFDQPFVPAGHLWLETTALSGSVQELSVTLQIIG